MLVLIALLITFAVYGLVGALIKLDDAGIHLARRSRIPAGRWAGRAIVRAAPAVFKILGVLGTVAMLWVGGQILAHSLAELGLTGPHHIIARAADLSGNPVLSWLLGTGAALVLGLLVGSVLAALAALAARVRRPATGA